MADCVFCPPEGRRFRTQRQCSVCGKPLCLVCRPEVSGVPFLCPECGGGPAEDSLHRPLAVVERISAAGHTVPYWLTVLCERVTVAKVDPDDLIVPE